MHNVPGKCLEKILRAKNQASLAFEKSFFWHPILKFGLLGVWFSKNRQKFLSTVANLFLRVTWCYNLYQTLTETLRNVFICITYLESAYKKFYEPKTKPRWLLKKAFLDLRFSNLAYLEYDFLKIGKNVSQLSRNHFYVSYDALNYTKSYLRL